MTLPFARGAALALCFALPTLAAPYTVDDMAAHETMGRVAVDPQERWAVVQTTRPWREAPSFDLSDQAYQALGRLIFVDLRRDGPGTPLVDHPGEGLIVGAPSANGEKLIVHRIRGRDRELGVLTLADRSFQWTGLTTEPSVFGNTAVWLSKDAVLVTAIDPNGARKRFGHAWQTQAALPRLWAAAARNETAVTVVGAGRFAHVHPEPPKTKLAVYDLRTGQVRTLLEREVVDFEVSPDRRQVSVLVEAEVAPVHASPVGNNTPLRRRRLMVVDTDGGRVDPCPSNLDVSADLIAWSPTGEALLAVAREDGQPWTGAKIYRLDSACRSPVALADRPVAGSLRERVAAGAPGAWLGDRPIGVQAGAWRELRPNGAVFGPGRLIAVDDDTVFLQQGERTRRIARSGVQANVHIAERALRRDPEAGGRVLLQPAQLQRRDWSSEASQAPESWRFDRVVHESGAVELIGRKGNARRSLATVNAPMKAMPVSLPLPVLHTDAAGAPLTSWLYLPTFRPSSPRPLIVVPYPGDTASASLAKSARSNAGYSVDVHVMTGRGHPVLVPSLPFENARDPGQGLAAAMLRAVDAAGGQYGVKTDRVAVWGHSYGGWAALMAAQQSPRFGVSIAAAPVTNFLAAYTAIDTVEATFPQYFLSSNAAWFETGRGGMGAPPWRDTRPYVSNSPAISADRQQAPALIAVGDLDFTTADARQMFGAMRRAGGDAVLRTYHGSDHEFISPAQLRDFYEAAFDFIDEALRPDAAPSPSPRLPRLGAAAGPP